ncbi:MULTISPECIES: efflux RND transporter periplasmic adaptor subunit [unclassified Agarivorans]|uniref:efflux RND transporter periplasmic adaptor subunit n=1 Tax=unclassified Agarivorans TaxID=2636026 RepID=UPI0026E4961C|nr:MULTISPECIES: efflux RND transporter periplasmic adaptor subunit [unclassified Agarivorans]MDO6685197.1 efflux RND transporter periplasmic adaptor subunit [Agarivorans sp. 3_MG-2023]MDO6715631.1 efflux RND transporter periplasmic adaptor subunit [Agarivorans sp. 2_MG-2023]
MMNTTVKTLALGSSLLLLVACSEPQEVQTIPSLNVITITISESAAQPEREFNARVEPAELTPLSFRVAGELTAMSIKPGQKVNKGQLLAQLDDRKIKQQVNDAKATFSLAERQLNRAQGLVGKSLLSQEEYDELEANFKLAGIDYQLAQSQLNYTQLRAPFSGLVAEVPKQSFENVAPGETAISIYQDDLVYVRLQLPDNLLAQIDPTERNYTYQPKARFAGTNELHTLTFLEHTSEPNPETQAFEVWMRMKQVSPAILPGTAVTMFVDLDAAGLVGKSGYLLPMTAIDPGSSDQQFYVWKVIEGLAQKVEVQVAQIHTEGVLVSEGLAQGDQIIVSSLARLRNGRAVNSNLQEQ